jgi:large subunit ribosomal protein L25
MEINDTLTLGSIAAPEGVTVLDDAETVIASVTPPTLEPVEDEIETETELVGEDGEPLAEAPAEGESSEGDESSDDS